MSKIVAAILIVAAFCAAGFTDADARARHHHRHRGVGLICGAVQMAHYGVGSRRALDWAVMFQRVSAPAPEIVVVSSRAGRDSAGGPGGHVARIVQVIDGCHALVSDSRGQYVRDICRNRVALVDPRRPAGGSASHRGWHRSAPAVRYAYTLPDRMVPQ